MPMGWAESAWYLNQLLAPVERALRRQGIQLVRYMDDWLLWSADRRTAARHAASVIESLTDLGIEPNLRKSALTPSRRVTFLGHTLDTRSATVAISREHQREIQRLARSLAASTTAPARLLARLHGKLAWACTVAPIADSSRHGIARQLSSVIRGCVPWDSVVPISRPLQRDLATLAEAGTAAFSRPMRLPPAWGTLTTDASGSGWGGDPHRARPRAPHLGVLDTKRRTVVVEPEGDRGNHASDVRPRLSRHPAAQPPDRAHRQHVGTRLLSTPRRQGRHLADTRAAGVGPHRRASAAPDRRPPPGVDNDAADALSRRHATPSDLCLRQETFMSLLPPDWPPPAVDLFASSDSHRLDCFVSRLPDQAAIGCDALLCGRDRWPSIYLFPPPRLTRKVWTRLLHYQGAAIWIVPRWQAAWYPTIAQVSCHHVDIPAASFFFPAPTHWVPVPARAFYLKPTAALPRSAPC
mmetsp:Transcript_11118/g.35304  ORF Transcript_11118/g.35304 Transcript_11118/m.35304 type:complete len:467 (+) Transcript_11118:1250-2650(+)